MTMEDLLRRGGEREAAWRPLDNPEPACHEADALQHAGGAILLASYSSDAARPTRSALRNPWTTTIPDLRYFHWAAAHRPL